jgi:hypothetical protein
MANLNYFARKGNETEMVEQFPGSAIPGLWSWQIWTNHVFRVANGSVASGLTAGSGLRQKTRFCRTIEVQK